MTCITPSNPDAIPFGESLDINGSLSTTSHGSLFRDGRPMTHESDLPLLAPLPRPLTPYEIQGEQHRVDRTSFLVAQTTASPKKIKELWEKEKSSGSSHVLPPKRLGMAETKQEAPKQLLAHHRASWDDERAVRAEAMAEFMAGPPQESIAAMRQAAQAKEDEALVAERKRRQEREEEEGLGLDLPQETLDEYSVYESLQRSRV